MMEEGCEQGIDVMRDGRDDVSGELTSNEAARLQVEDDKSGRGGVREDTRL
jgi:hypothetical protein